MEDIQNLINELDEIQQNIEELEKDWVIQDYLQFLKAKEVLVEKLKTSIKEWEDIKETQTLLFNFCADMRQ